ncbi:MAG TPA: TIGR04282 family arsenosugar biosynthesis glycosyltransferase [Thermoanaerobaculia bacterium]|nr:TIGR04282 family arsenosugar biosynthesis glycosyltransferase [Thermoanaerobaculia bacterium]
MLFAKPPRSGRVKTRLIGEVTADRAAEIYRAFLLDLTGELAGGSFELRLAWALDGDEEQPPFEPPLPSTALVQHGADLGARLHRALATLVEFGHERVAAVGSDHPELRAARVEEAFRALDRYPVVIGPALDGGYYLIALRARLLHPRLFEDIAWSTDSVLEQTIARCTERGLSWRLLEPAADVDTPADLEALARRLRRHPEQCPRTAAVLREWGRL